MPVNITPTQDENKPDVGLDRFKYEWVIDADVSLSKVELTLKEGEATTTASGADLSKSGPDPEGNYTITYDKLVEARSVKGQWKHTKAGDEAGDEFILYANRSDID